MRTRLWNGEDEEKLLEAVRETANVKQSTQTDFVREAESVEQLSDRLKAAGDEELLNDEKEDQEEKKDDVAVEGNGGIYVNGESVQKIDNEDLLWV